MKKFSIVFAFLATFALLYAESPAAIILSFGNGGVVDLLPNTAGQVVELNVSGGDSFDGLELDLQVGDGGVLVFGPAITSIDLTTNTVFSAHGPNQFDVVALPYARQSTVDTASLTTANGVLARITFDTTGVAPGDYDFLLNDVALLFDTTFFNGANPLIATVSDGTLRVSAVPEPSTLAGVTALCIGAVIRRRMNKRSKAVQ